MTDSARIGIGIGIGKRITEPPAPGYPGTAPKTE
jgi:hypothetical protein